MMRTRTLSSFSLHTLTSFNYLHMIRHIMAGLLATSFFLSVPFGFAMLEWIYTEKGTWVVIQGKLDAYPLILFSFALSFTQTVSICLFLFIGLITLFRFERDRGYQQSQLMSIIYFLAWVQTLTYTVSMIPTVIPQLTEHHWFINLLPYLPHLWMVLVAFAMFYQQRRVELYESFYRLDLGKILFIVLLLYGCVYFFLDKWITLPIAEWFSLELSSWREQNIDHGIQQAGQQGILFILIQWLFIGCLGPIAEEIFFRGMLQKTITKHLGVILGIVLPAVMFALFHVDIPLLAPLLVLGLILGWLRHHFGYLWVPILFHMLNNSISILLDLF